MPNFLYCSVLIEYMKIICWFIIFSRERLTRFMNMELQVQLISMRICNVKKERQACQIVMLLQKLASYLVGVQKMFVFASLPISIVLTAQKSEKQITIKGRWQSLYSCFLGQLLQDHQSQYLSKPYLWAYPCSSNKEFCYQKSDGIGSDNLSLKVINSRFPHSSLYMTVSLDVCVF